MPDLNLVPSGVALLCDKGAGLGGLQATNNGAFYVHEEPAATEADLLPVTNIMPCGVCSILHGPCLPQPLRWNNVHPSLVAGPLDAHPLLENSTLQCLTGGTIRILFAAEAAAVANDLNNAAMAKQRAQEAKEAADGLFWAGVAVAGVAALVVGVAAVVVTGGAALPLVAAAATVALEGAAVGAIVGLAVGATAGAVEGYGHGGWEGAKQGAQQGAVQGLLMGAAAGAVSAIGLGAALLPSVAAFGWGVANDAAAMYYQPNLENGLVLAGDVVILIGGRTAHELAKGRPAIEKMTGGKGPVGESSSNMALRSLSYDNIKFTKKGIAVVEKHLERFGRHKHNDVMIERLKAIEDGRLQATEYDKNFIAMS
jgi:hypothetical protein